MPLDVKQPMRSQDKSKLLPLEARERLSRRCARHGNYYAEPNCFACVTEGTLLCEFIQYVLPKSADAARGVVPRRARL
jgi:hypothetical protein